MYPVDEFVQLAPPEARTDSVMSDAHQLMLNRLGFELAERQRYVPHASFRLGNRVFITSQAGKMCQRAYPAKGGS